MSGPVPAPPSPVPAPNFIPLCVPEIRGNEWAYVKDCLDTGWVSSVGSYVDRFERELAGYVGSPHAVAAVNGTSALHIALLLAGVEPDDEVLVSTITFIAPANAIRYANAWPVFVDADPDVWQMDPEKLAGFLERDCEGRDGVLRNRRTGRRVRAIMPVHILGHPCDLDPLLELARRYELAVIEDATESLGATYRGKAVGTLGDSGCFSFNGNKLITTGGGGMLVTGREDWARRAKHLTTQAKTGDAPTEYIHDEVGYNYRLTNVLAAIGCAQLELLDEYVAAKLRISARYRDALADVPGLTMPPRAEWAAPVDWLFTVLVDEARYGTGSRDLLRRLGERKIQTRPLWEPMHLSQPHRGGPATDCSVAERLYRQALSLPCSVGLTETDQDRVIAALREFAAV